MSPMSHARLKAAAPLAIAAALALLLAAGGVTGTIDRAWFDTLQRTLATRAPIPDDTAIVLVDEQSLRALGAEPYAMRWPWPRRAFAGLFAALHHAGAKHIVADFLFLETSSDAVDDTLLASTAAGLRNVTLGALRDRDNDGKPALPVVWPEEFRQRHAALFPPDRPRWGWVDIAPDSDGVIRRYTPAGSLAAGAFWTRDEGRGTRDNDRTERTDQTDQTNQTNQPNRQSSSGFQAFRSSELSLRWRGGLERLQARGVPVLPAAPFAAAGLRLLNEATAQCSDFENPAALAAAIAALGTEVGGVSSSRQGEQDAPPTLPADLAARVRGRVVFIGANAAGTFDMIATPVGAPEPGVLAHWTAFADMRAGTFARDAGWGAAALAALAVMLLVSLVARKPFPFGVRRLVAAFDGGTCHAATPAQDAVAGRQVGPSKAVTSHRTPKTAPQNPQSITSLAIVACALALAALLASAVLLQFFNRWFPPMLVVAGTLCVFASELTAGYLRERALKREIQSWFGAYVSPDVVENLIRNPDSLALGGERRELTVFFSDIAGFTTLSERLPSEQLVSLVNRYLNDLSESVLGHGCYIDKYIGDAIMAVFGAPQPLENHALAACRAALDSQRRLDALNDSLETTHGTRLAIRIGINTGQMIVGNVGSEKKKNYTVLGDAVNLAARLEGANKEFDTTILIGPQTAAAVSAHLALRPVAHLRVKGKTESVLVHELIGEPSALTETQRAHLRACAEAFEHWCARRFAEAAEAGARALALRPDDALSARYREAALAHAATPPPDDWQPVLELHTK